MKWTEAMGVTLVVLYMLSLFNLVYQTGRLIGILDAFAQTGACK